MLTYILRRFLYSIPVLVATSFLIFTFVSITGDPLGRLRANPNITAEQIHAIEHSKKLDKPVIVRYGYWVRDAFTKQFGTTLFGNRKIWPDLKRVIGHTRYSTTGSSQWSNAQPIVKHGSARTIALGHNGNLTNAGELRETLAADAHPLATTADTEVIASLIANDRAPLADAVAGAMHKLDGAFSVVALSEGKLIAFRDPRGMRPLCLGRLDGDWVVASETCALDLVGAE